MYCNKCGQMIPDGSVFCNSCGAKQVQPTSAHATPRPVMQQPVQHPEEAKESMPAYYHLISWLTFAFLLVVGFSRFKPDSSDRAAIHAIVTCLAALIFIPQVTVGSKEKPLVVYAVKWIVAALVLILL